MSSANLKNQPSKKNYVKTADAKFKEEKISVRNSHKNVNLGND
jgi:ribosome recycling factor